MILRFSLGFYRGFRSDHVGIDLDHYIKLLDYIELFKDSPEDSAIVSAVQELFKTVLCNATTSQFPIYLYVDVSNMNHLPNFLDLIAPRVVYLQINDRINNIVNYVFSKNVQDAFLKCINLKELECCFRTRFVKNKDVWSTIEMLSLQLKELHLEGDFLNETDFSNIGTNSQLKTLALCHLSKLPSLSEKTSILSNTTRKFELMN